MAMLVLMAGLLVLASQCTNDNVRPVALFTVDPAQGSSPLAVNFDGSGSYDPDGTIEAYSWNFGDGTAGTGVTTSHTFDSSTDRTFSVELTVTDNGGRTHSISGSVVVYGSGSGVVLFFDDFEDGLDPAWSVTPGWDIRNGVLLINSVPWAYAYVSPGKDWQNYIVETNMLGGVDTGGIILRCQEDLQSYVLVYGDLNTLHWSKVVNGETIDSGSQAPGFFVGNQRVKIIANDTHFNVYVNELHRMSFTVSGLSAGMPGLAGHGGRGAVTGFEDFLVTALE